MKWLTNLVEEVQKKCTMCKDINLLFFFKYIELARSGTVTILHKLAFVE